MNGLSPDIDISFLLGTSLLQVCVGKNDLILNFDRDVRITLLSDFSFQEKDGLPEIYRETTVGAIALFLLLHDTVEQASATEGGGLMLKFASGRILEAFDTSQQYESFWIANGDQQIIV